METADRREWRGPCREADGAPPRLAYLPSLDVGRHEGNHRAEGGHGLSDIDAVNEKLLARGEPPGVMVAKISHSLEDRKPLEPGQLGCRVWIRRIWHPEISAGPHDSFDDFIGEVPCEVLSVESGRNRSFVKTKRTRTLV